MKLSDYAKQMGVCYETAWRRYRDEKTQGRRVGPRTIIITGSQETPATPAPQQVAIYACGVVYREQEQPGSPGRTTHCLLRSAGLSGGEGG